MRIETLVVQVTNQCPFNCSQCYVELGEKSLTIGNLLDLKNFAVKNNVKMIQITGGEPMVYPNIVEAVQLFSSSGLMTVIATSGYSLSVKRLKELKEVGLTALCISLNGFNYKTDSLSRNTFLFAYNAINLCQRIDIPYFINFVITKDNFKDLKELAEYAKQKNATGINILKPFGLFYKEKILSESELNKLRAMIENDDFYRVENCYREYFSLSLQEKPICEDAGGKSWFVRADMKCAVCSKNQKELFSLNEIGDTITLDVCPFS